jgi:hypothetical protein
MVDTVHYTTLYYTPSIHSYTKHTLIHRPYTYTPDTTVAGGECVSSYLYTLIHSYTHTLIHSYTHTLIHSYTHTHPLVHSYTHPPMHPCTHTPIHPYTHSLIRPYPYTHTLAGGECLSSYLCIEILRSKDFYLSPMDLQVGSAINRYSVAPAVP